MQPFVRLFWFFDWPGIGRFFDFTWKPFVRLFFHYLGVDQTAPSPWRYALRRTWHGFIRHRTLDAAATLAFFSTLTVFPAALILISAVSLGVGDDRDAVSDILHVASIAIGPDAAMAISSPLEALLKLSDPGVSLGVGIVLTVYSLSGYTTAFGRALDNIYDIQEGRRYFWFRSQMLLVTLALMVAFACIAVILLTTPAVAQGIGDQFVFGEPFVVLWDIVKWPVLAALIVFVIILLYYYTPNVKHPRVRWVSYGAVLAMGGWALATVGFAVYVITFSNYDHVYGFLGGAVVILVYSLITNLVLVIGGELDAQFIRVRYLQHGVEAEKMIPFPLRDTKRNLALARHQAMDIRDGRTIRVNAVRDGTTNDHVSPDDDTVSTVTAPRWWHRLGRFVRRV